MAYEYIVDGKVISLPVDPEKVAVRFEESASGIKRQSSIDDSDIGDYKDRFEVPNESITIIDISPTDQPSLGRLVSVAGVLNEDPNVAQVLPVFDLGETRKAVVTDRISIGFKPTVEDNQAREIINDIQGEVVKANEFGEYVVRLMPDVNPFNVIKNLTEKAEVNFAEPDFVTIGEHRMLRNKPDSDENSNNNGSAAISSLINTAEILNLLFKFGRTLRTANEGVNANFNFVRATSGISTATPNPLQYAIGLTKTDQAWNLVTPSPDIKIAILDEGVDVTHPDLKPLVKGTFDAITGTANQQPNDWDAHGTACAGLAVAKPGDPNNAQAVYGTGSGCSLLAVRIAYSNQSDRRKLITTDSQISEGIDWAWQNGADILSNSWGGGPPSNKIIEAFKRAQHNGRGGKGCVVVIAAGNEAVPIYFPADQPNLLTVTASNQYDEPKTRTSRDGERWGSNFGPNAGVAAPGVRNYTTDIVGTAGYNTSSTVPYGDYYATFNGTSSATPIVAGIAGLMLSKNPERTQAEIIDIIKATADQVGAVTYTNNHNEQMGHGRINAFAAVLRA